MYLPRWGAVSWLPPSSTGWHENWVPSGSICKRKGAPGLQWLLSSCYQAFSDLDQVGPGLTCHQEAWKQLGGSDFPHSCWEGKKIQDFVERRRHFPPWVSQLAGWCCSWPSQYQDLLSLQQKAGQSCWPHADPPQLPSFSKSIPSSATLTFLFPSVPKARNNLSRCFAFAFYSHRRAKRIITIGEVRAGKRPFRPFQSPLRGKRRQGSHRTFSGALISSIFVLWVAED